MSSSTSLRRSFGVAAALALAAATGTATADAADAVTVQIADRLEPAIVTAGPGSTITWENVDDERHRIRSREGPEEFDSGNLEPGESFTLTLSAEGDYPYLDERDPDDPAYHGTVTITTGGGAASPGGSGGSSDGSAPTGSGGNAGNDGSSSTGPTAVAILDRSFSPRTVAVATGTTLTWTNRSDRDHTVSFQGGGGSGVLGGGATFRRTFDQPGTFSYLCAIHPEMTGTVEVAGGARSTGGGPSRPASGGAGGSSGDGASAPAGGSPSAPSEGSTATSSGGATTRSARPAGRASVRIVDLDFAPRTIEVTAGTTVTWRNEGAVPHTVTGSGFDSGFLDPGGTFRHRFSGAGTYDYRCALHPSMTGRVAVTAADGAGGVAAATSEDGAVPGGPTEVGAVDGPPVRTGDAPTSTRPATAAAPGAVAASRTETDPDGPVPTALVGAGLVGMALGAGGAVGTRWCLRRRRRHAHDGFTRS